MSDEIRPVLTPEEWAMPMEAFAWKMVLDASHDDRLKLAVRWLHEAGWFTWEDVDRLRSQADWYEKQTSEVVYACPPEMMPGWQLRNLADRIAALLPPRED